MNISEEQKRQCKILFDSYQEIMDKAKELAAERKAVIEHFGRICEVKSGIAGKILKSMAKKYEGEEPEENIILEAIELITTV